ncbi:MAG TPA: HAD family phosphatase [Arachidicoccus sp.]
MQQIKNIIFDLGGVFLDISFIRSNEAFKNLGVEGFDKFISQHHADDLFEKLEIGKISPEEFYNEFRKKVNLPLTDWQIENAWNAMLLHFSEERMRWLEEISKRYNIYLFSNTNKIHVDYFTKLCMQEIGKPLESYFIKAWYSNEVGVRKPYPASFSKLLEEENLLAHETLFIDDTIGNIEGAKEIGLHTVHLAAPQTVLNLDV